MTSTTTTPISSNAPQVNFRDRTPLAIFKGKFISVFTEKLSRDNPLFDLVKRVAFVAISPILLLVACLQTVDSQKDFGEKNLNYTDFEKEAVDEVNAVLKDITNRKGPIIQLKIYCYSKFDDVGTFSEKLVKGEKLTDQLQSCVHRQDVNTFSKGEYRLFLLAKLKNGNFHYGNETLIVHDNKCKASSEANLGSDINNVNEAIKKLYSDMFSNVSGGDYMKFCPKVQDNGDLDP